MARAPLRPVPSRPAGPINPAAAVRQVALVLPELSALEARALALVALAGRPRAEVAGTLGIDEGELASVLAGARKELRRTVAPLGGSGWCERAERLISDRLDGELSASEARRLDVHLRNCPRCVEHERRLVQATDVLLTGLAVPGSGPGLVAVPPPPLAAVPAEASAEPAAPEPDPAAPEPLRGAGWHVLVAIVVILTLAAIALAVAALLGAGL